MGKNGLSRFVIDDQYFEQASGFASCSYIAPDSPVSILASGDGSAPCIVRVAQNEIGYTEAANGWTKYGYWASPSNPTMDWCVAFVAWCANQADVPTSVVPKMTFVEDIQDFYLDRGLYLYSYYRGGSSLPRAGDIIMISWSGGGINHVGIVTGVDSTYVYYVDGNNGEISPHVNDSKQNLTSAVILGYGRPSYQAENHTSLTAWAFSATHHWKVCENCLYTVKNAEHAFAIDPETGLSTCIVCGYEE